MFLLCCEVDLMGKKRSSFVLYINSFAMQTPPSVSFTFFYISATTNNFYNKTMSLTYYAHFNPPFIVAGKNFHYCVQLQIQLKAVFHGVFVEAFVK